jgi:hypothetical protein
VTPLVRATSIALGLAAAVELSGCCNVNAITTDSLPDATVGQLYSFALTHNCSSKSANEGAAWDLVDGAPPPGIMLSFDGRLLGTPTLAGTFSFRVLLSRTTRELGGVTDQSSVDSRAFTLTVRP